jgi:hypothetical protein
VITPAERRLVRWIVVVAILTGGWLTHRGIWFVW